MGYSLHFISHTHWDREWYMSFEQHRFRLVELMDRLLETLDRNPDFKSFHLDGQMILLEDYLEIKPHMEEKIIRYVQQGRLKIGPWYVLQDVCLTSGEANIRNLMMGIRQGNRFGPVCMVGYFPDTFGNIGQAPQILQGFGVDSAVFGRGLNPVGTNNTVMEGRDIFCHHSEVIWRSPDGSEVLGIYFANWYHNAMEIPSDKLLARETIAAAAEKAARSASTPHLLLMNGCDHQPVQVDLPEILDSVRSEFVGDELIHSNFERYVSEIMPYRGNLDIVEGELTGQHTDGMLTLVNTASSRLYLKQLNHQAQNLLEKWAEPLATMAWIAGDTYRSEFFVKAWKYLLQNHTHDSICGCSIDEVHQEMVVRYKKSMAISRELISRGIRTLAAKVDTSAISADAIPVVVFNPMIWDVSEPVLVCIDFPDGEKLQQDELKLADKQGNAIAVHIDDKERVFCYELPEDTFRKVKYVRRLEIRFMAEGIPGMGYKTFLLKKVMKSGEPVTSLKYGDNYAENEHICLKVNPDGSLKVTNKENGFVFDNLNVFEDSGDIGDEYNFVATEEPLISTAGGCAEVSIFNNSKAHVTFRVGHTLKLPAAAQKAAKHRGSEFRVFNIVTYLTLWAGSRRIDIITEFDNNLEDHRLRALFPTGVRADQCCADVQFDIVKRDIKPWSGWKNPSNCQRQQAFVEVSDDQSGLVVANRGLPEYEILRDGRNTIALTLLRSIAELGDWGYFPTPGAQCPGKHVAEYSIIPFVSEKDRKYAHRQAYQFAAEPFLAVQSDIHQGELDLEASFIPMECENIVGSALKKSETGDGIILRVYNPYADEGMAYIKMNEEFKEIGLTGLNEEWRGSPSIQNGVVQVRIPSKKIETIELIMERRIKQYKKKGSNKKSVQK